MFLHVARRGSIQEWEVKALNRRNAARGRGEVTPIYTQADAIAALQSFSPVDYEKWVDVIPGVRARYWNAGHLLGSASIEIECIDRSRSIGAMNDYVDEPLDRLACRREKPLVAGDLSRNAALAIWIATALLGFAASYAFNLATAAIAVVLWLLGVSYNFWPNERALSWLPFAGFYPSLPLWGFVAAGKFTPALLLTYPVCVPLAVALNIANTLPISKATLPGGVKGFTHRLGQSRALFLLWLCLAATMILMAAAGLLIGGHLNRLIPGLVAGAFCLLGAMMADWAFLRSPATLRRTFYLSAAGALVLGCAWIVSLP